MAIGTTAATLISAVAPVVGGMMSSDAAGDAAAAQQQSNAAAIAEQRRQFNKIVELNEPFRQSNLRAMSAQEDLLGLGGGGGGPSQPSDTGQEPPAQLGTEPARQRIAGRHEQRQAFRNRRGREQFQEEQINRLFDSPNALQNRRQFWLSQPEDAPGRQNALARIDRQLGG